MNYSLKNTIEDKKREIKRDRLLKKHFESKEKKN